MPKLLGYFLFFFIYVVLPFLVVFMGYKLYTRMKYGKIVPLDAIETDKPITAKQLPSHIIKLLNSINDKGSKLTALFNKDDSGKIHYETKLLVEKVLTRDVPLAINHYEDMVQLKGQKAQNIDIKHSKMTAEQSLQDILNKIDTEMDSLLLSEYHNQGQKLLEISRYIDSRFENDDFLK